MNKEDTEDAEDLVKEEIPKIFHPEVLDVFHMFANMLDVKSFVRLTMTSKKMYKRCMEDKAILVEGSEEEEAVLEVTSVDDVPLLHFFPKNIARKHIKQYIATLRRLPCRVPVEQVMFCGKTNDATVRIVREFLEEVVVRSGPELEIQDEFTGWQEIIPFIEDLSITYVKFFHVPDVPLHILQSLFPMELSHLLYDEPTTPQFLLNIESAVDDLDFPGMQNFEKNEFMQLLWKIQTGTLKRVTLNPASMDLSVFSTLPFGYDGLLPADRPLVFRFDLVEDSATEYWFLHWNGGVTKCEKDAEALIVKKAEKNDYPPVLRTKEEVFEHLSQPHEPYEEDECCPRISCSSAHFRSFYKGFKMLEASHKGPLPEKRPLYCKVSEDEFWLINENGSIENCEWRNGYAMWNRLSTEKFFGHPALAKHVFEKVIQERTSKPLKIYCEGREEFNSWLEDFKSVYFNILGPLPDERPLVFKMSLWASAAEFCVILFEDDYVLQCRLVYHDAILEPCDSWNRPPILISTEHVKDILLAICRNGHVITFRLDLETFRGVFEELKTACDGSSKSPHVFERKMNNNDGDLAEERWFSVDGKVTKAVWKGGRVTLSPGDSQHFPKELTTFLLREFAKGTFSSTYSLILESTDSLQWDVEPTLKTLSCDDPLPLMPKEEPLVFVREESKRKKPDEFYKKMWFLWDGVKMTCATYGEEGPGILSFRENVLCQEMPRALVSKEYLKRLVEGKWEDKKWSYKWMGRKYDFQVLLDEYTTVKSYFDGPLPEERPLLVEEDENDRYILREDGTVIECSWRVWGVNVRIADFNDGDYIPHAFLFL